MDERNSKIYLIGDHLWCIYDLKTNIMMIEPAIDNLCYQSMAIIPSQNEMHIYSQDISKYQTKHLIYNLQFNREWKSKIVKPWINNTNRSQIKHKQ